MTELEKLMQRLDKQTNDWNEKIKNFENDRVEIKTKIEALKKAQDEILIKAHTGDAKAQKLVEDYRLEIINLDQQFDELGRVAELALKEIEKLEDQKKEVELSIERVKFQDFCDRRLEIFNKSIAIINQLLPELVEYRKITMEIQPVCRKLDLKYDQLYIRQTVVNYLQTKLNSVYPNDFPRLPAVLRNRPLEDEQEILNKLMIDAGIKAAV